MSEALGHAAARTAHDVGKHVARAARNLPPDGPIPEALVAMLAKDLYETDGERRASALLEDRAEPLLQSAEAAPVIERCRSALARADRLEGRVRAGDAEAVRRAAQIAREVEAELRGLASTLRGEGSS